jgi:hypothetical protein
MNYVETQLKKLAPITLEHDLSPLSKEEIQTIKLLVKASKLIDNLFLQQVCDKNILYLEKLTKSRDPKNQIYLDFFKIMFGPWDRLNGDKPFLNSNPKPDGAAYYPSDMTRDEFRHWLIEHPEETESFESNFTMIRRDGNKLIAIPYSDFFKKELVTLKTLLKQAANITTDLTLKTFLENRSEAFFSNDYYKSDIDWMDLSGNIEVVIGPYEVYEDKLFGYKTAFESFICIVDHEESEKQKEIGKYLDDMEDNLPINDKYKNFDRGTYSPIKIANLIYSAGDTKAGIQTTAFNLPNDEKVRETKGSKKVMLKNVMKAKFEKCWIPIVNIVLSKKTLDRVSFDGYFMHTLMHEISHGLGPGKITVGSKETTVNKELREHYSIIEECKADVLSIYLTQYLIDRNILSKKLESTLYASNLGGMFRSIRFGIEEAHGGGVAIQLDYYLEKGAFLVDNKGRFSVNENKMKKVVKNLAKKLLLIEAKGDYKGAKEFINKYRNLRPEIVSVLEKLTHVPIDIKPIYPIEDKIK